MGFKSPNVVEYSDGPWEDVIIPAMSLGAGSSAPDLVAFDGGNLRCLAFDGGSTTEQLFGAFEMPHAYKEGSTVSFHVHWSPTTTNTGNVVWQCEHSLVNPTGTFPSATSVKATAAAAGGTAWVHKLTAFPDQTMSGITIGAVCIFRLFRDPTDAGDTYPDDACLLSIGLHFQRDTPGSAQRTSKT